MIKQIKSHLNNSIQSIIGQKVEFVKQDEQAFTRKRSLSLETMIRTILGMGGKSLSKELLVARLTVSNSAFVQRRYQIKPEAFYALFKEFTVPIPLNTDFPIFAADGSDICIPRNPMDTKTSIQTQTDVKSYNLMHINALYDLTTGVYRDVFIQDQHAQHERLALIQMMEALPFDKALVIMDRGYESYNLMAHFQEKGWLYIIRIRDGKQSMRSSFNLPNTECFDQTFSLTLSRKQTNQLKKLYRDFPNDYHFIPHNSTFDFLPETSQKQDPVVLYELPFRMVRLEVDEGKYETLVTNTDYSIQELKNLYASRWGIETSFRDLKYSVGLVNFHAKKKEGILQEIFARFTNFNFCRWVISQVAIDSSRKKQRYKVCFSDAAYACRLFFNCSLSSLQLKNYLKKQLSIIRPNRKYPRKIKAQSVVDFIYRVT
ncbi:IS4 family transposase [Streptococcus sp. 27098_8_76]|uniref:IS4 family transposase n=1 Tax=Streptococcus sp. 27098_8_76 TaxID=3003658 RepID=UPI00352D1AE0